MLLVGCSLAVAISGCGSNELTLSEYASEVEALVAEMESRFVSIDAEWLGGPPSVDRAAEYWEDRLEIRDDFLDAIKELRPPEDVEAMHAQSIDIFTKITQADVALRAKAESFTELDSHWQWVDTPEGRASDAVLEDVYAFCRESQEEFDETRDRDALAEMPWIPSEMKEVVRVAFGCPPSN
jgi:hypothetical protein